jgi:hypothetical protein
MRGTGKRWIPDLRAGSYPAEEWVGPEATVTKPNPRYTVPAGQAGVLASSGAILPPVLLLAHKPVTAKAHDSKEHPQNEKLKDDGSPCRADKLR